MRNTFLSLLFLSLFTLLSCSKDETNSEQINIGDNFQGGIVAYIFELGDPGYIEDEVHGIIVAKTDQGDGLQWSNGTDLIVETERSIGKGQENTDSIIAKQGEGNYAAMLCKNLVLGGYDDWYLPSMDELNLLYLNKDSINGNFMGSNWYYWSSTERDMYNAWAQCLADGDQRCDAGNKSIPYLIRPIRSF